MSRHRITQYSDSRVEFLNKVLELIHALDRPYFARRGSINWMTFKWPKDFAMAVRTSEVFPDSPRGSSVITLEIQTATRLDDSRASLIDDMFDDVRLVMDAMKDAKRPDGRSYVINSKFLGAVEMSDIEAGPGVEGWFMNFTVEI